jgi:DNA-binding transcriptional MerR regulator
MASEPQAMTLAEVAAKSGFPGRTIRFYIARGLLPGPGKAGRGATYGPGHLARLREIRDLQGQGFTLLEIAQRLSGGTRAAAALEPTPWWLYPVAADVVVSVRSDVSPWRLKQIRNHLAQMAASLRAEERKAET